MLRVECVLSRSRLGASRAVSQLAKGLYAFGVVSALATQWPALTWVDTLARVSWLAWPLFVVSFLVAAEWGAKRASLEITDSSLVVSTPGRSPMVVPREGIRGVLFTNRVEIELASGNLLNARIADASEAHAVLRELGFVAGQKSVRAGLAGPSRRWMHLAIALFAYLASAVVFAGIGRSLVGPTALAVALLSPLLTLAIYELVKRLLRAPELTIGDDGVQVKAGLRSFFVPRSDIAQVTAAGTTIVIVRPNGGQVLVGGGIQLEHERVSDVARIILERCAAPVLEADHFATFERAGRTIAAWRQHLASALSGDAGYRASGATADQAAEVLASALATPAQRVGAALALRIANEPTARARIAESARTSADDDLRSALEVVAESDDDTKLEIALRALG